LSYFFIEYETYDGLILQELFESSNMEWVMSLEIKIPQLFTGKTATIENSVGGNQLQIVGLNNTETPIQFTVFINGVTHNLLCHLDIDTFVPVVISHVYDTIHRNKVSLGSWRNENVGCACRKVRTIQIFLILF